MYNKTPPARPRNNTKIPLITDTSFDSVILGVLVLFVGLAGGVLLYKAATSENKRGIGVLPRNLSEALDELESDRKFLNPIYTNDVVDKIIELERRDKREIAIRPPPHEFYLYFDC